MGTFTLCLLLLAGVAEERFLSARLAGLAETYEGQVHRQSDEAIARRVAVIREIGHLPWSGAARSEAAAFLAGVIRGDRAYRVRAETIRAIGRIGTPRALDAMYRALFGRAGRSPRYALLHTVLPDALAHLDGRGDWEWLRASVLHPALARQPSGLRHLAAHRADEMLIVTIEAAGRAGRGELAADLRPFASSSDAAVRAAALRALGRMRGGEDLLATGLRDPEEAVRMAAARAGSLPWPQLQRALADPSLPVRRSALRNLAARSEGLALPRLISALGSETVYAARRDAHRLLVERTGEDFGLDAQLWAGWNRARRGAARRDTTSADRRFEAGRVLLVVDVSASMARVAVDGRTMQQQAVAALRALIGKMPRSARFAALGFASELRRLPTRSNAAPNPEDLLAWLADLKPAGASNSYAALMQGIRDPLRPDTIIFVSDGVPRHCSWRGNTYSEPEQILHEVREANRVPMIRIDAIGLLGGTPTGDERLDAQAATAFLRRLAKDGEGTYSEIR